MTGESRKYFSILSGELRNGSAFYFNIISKKDYEIGLKMMIRF